VNSVNHKKKPWYRSKWFNLAIGSTVTVACLGWAFHTMRDDGQGGLKPTGQVIGEIVDAFRQADYRTLPWIWLALVAFYAIKAWRWKLLLSSFGSFRTMTDLLPSVMIGFAFNNVLPAHLGEFVRMYVFSREHDVPRTGALASIAVERIFDIIAILSLLLVGMMTVDSSQLDSSIVTSAWVFSGVVCVALGGAAVYLIWTEPYVRFVESTLGLLPFVPSAVSGKVRGILESGAEGLAALKSPSLLIGVLLTSIAQWILNGSMIYLSLLAFDIEVSVGVAAIVLGVVAFGVTDPSTPGYFGIIQLCFLLVLKLFITEGETQLVFAASIYYHMAQWIPVTMIGMGYFLRAGFRLSDLDQDDESSNFDVSRQA